ncbi:MAG: AAA family ATPase [Treponema sp.]|nr:AAA family ATPase [Treponema sp.]
MVVAKHTKKVIIVALCMAIIYGAYMAFEAGLFGSKKIHTTYKAFNDAVEQGTVVSVAFGTDTITYTCGADEKQQYVTDNPQSPLLRERLLLRGIQVKEEVEAGYVVSNILDIFFYIIFFGSIVLVFRKFISPNTFHVVHKTGATFKDVVGMDALKRSMLQITDIMLHPDQYAKKGIRMPKGVILEGAPGNGKTLFARALAGEAKVNFIPAKATDFESMFIAIGPAKVKFLFRKARRKAPCIVFIDEFDGIGTKRKYNGTAVETENTRIVTALLNELDGFTQNSGVLVLAATNSVHALDEALIRPGRFDALFTVPYPDKDARLQLLEMYMQKKNAAEECTPATLQKLFEGSSCAKIESAINTASLLAAQVGRDRFTIADVQAAIKRC